MGRVTTFVNISVNGFFEGAAHDISWHNVDEEFNLFAIQILRESDVILFGRRTYQLFENFWPSVPKDPAASQSNLEIASLINNVDKIVFSKTLTKVEEKENWKNIRLFHEVQPDFIEALKQQYKRNLGVGGNNLLINFVRLRLIDEIRVMINPVMIQEGKFFLQGIQEKVRLRLLETRTFKSGNVLLRYEPLSEI
jgi:dihydrofolate reductase